MTENYRRTAESCFSKRLFKIFSVRNGKTSCNNHYLSGLRLSVTIKYLNPQSPHGRLQTQECPCNENLKSYNSRDLWGRFRCTNPDRGNRWKTIKSTEKLPRDKTWLKKLSSAECRGAHDRKNYITNSIRKKLAASLLDICAALCGNANGSINHVQHWALKSSVKAANLPFSGDLISFASTSPAGTRNLLTLSSRLEVSHELVMTLGTLVILTSSILITDLGLVCRTLPGGVYYSSLSNGT